MLKNDINVTYLNYIVFIVIILMFCAGAFKDFYEPFTFNIWWYNITTKQSNQWVYFYKKEDVIGNLEVPDEALSLKKKNTSLVGNK